MHSYIISLPSTMEELLPYLIDLTFTLLKINAVLILANVAAFFLLRKLLGYVAKRTPTAQAIYAKGTAQVQKLNQGASRSPLYLGIFHPYCNAGGGGERVLWCSVAAIQEKYPHVHCVVYTGDTESEEDIIAGALNRFGVRLDASSLSFVRLTKRAWVEAEPYPHFTMLCQSIGSLVLGWEAITQFLPDVYYDSMGYAFTFPIFSLLGRCPIYCYVHYPTISTDMLARVQERREDVTNTAAIAHSPTKSFLKLVYYRIFALLYRIVGSFSRLTMVNSTWTYNHITSLWHHTATTHILYPPCDTTSFQKLPLTPRLTQIVSLAQFRPEKNHALQIRAYARFLSAHPEYRGKIKLILVGGCRNAGDQARVDVLQALTATLNLTNEDVQILVNLPFSDLKTLLGQSLVGLHTMCEEHFGIGIVEYMAAGLIALVHNSGGPRSDIVVDSDDGVPNGFRAATEEQYAEALANIFAMDSSLQQEIQAKGRARVADKFSEEAFKEQFIKLMAPSLT